MPYLIDGHNLIPRVGLSLEAIDDEMDLVEILQDFSRRTRARIEVFFDGAPPGSVGTRRFGIVTVHFVPAASTADAAIEGRLRRLGRSAKNWIVVSSDRRVQRAAAGAKAHVVSADDFAAQITGSSGAVGQQSSRSTARAERGLSEDEIQKWLDLFGKAS
jgi:uncharacterized protein